MSDPKVETRTVGRDGVQRIEVFRGGFLGMDWSDRSAVPDSDRSPGAQAIDAAKLAELVATVAANDADPNAKSSACETIETQLPLVCGYASAADASPWLCGRDYGCVELNRVSKCGRTASEQNFSYSMQNHSDMVKDAPRVRAYAAAIGRVAPGRKAVDIGAGPYCLLSRLALNAGALAVDSIEQNGEFVAHALDTFGIESRGDHIAPAIGVLRSAAGAVVLSTMFDVSLDEIVPVQDGVKEGHGLPRCRVTLTFKTGAHAAADNSPGSSDESDDFSDGVTGALQGSSSDGEYLDDEELADAMVSEADDAVRWLRLHHGYSTACSSLAGPYELVVHEILGHVASAEGVVGAISDLHKRKLVAPVRILLLILIVTLELFQLTYGLFPFATQSAVFVPSEAGTMLSPTAPLSLTDLETLVHRHANDDDPEIATGVKYQARRVPESAILAEPQPIEWFDFADERTLSSVQQRTARFIPQPRADGQPITVVSPLLSSSYGCVYN